MSSEGERAKDAIGAVLLEALTEMVEWDQLRGGVVEREPQEEWVLWWESAPDGTEGAATLYGNLGQVVIEYMNLDGPGDPYPMPPYSTRECDALLAIAQAYSDWVEADDE